MKHHKPIPKRRTPRRFVSKLKWNTVIFVTYDPGPIIAPNALNITVSSDIGSGIKANHLCNKPTPGLGNLLPLSCIWPRTNVSEF